MPIIILLLGSEEHDVTAAHFLIHLSMRHINLIGMLGEGIVISNLVNFYHSNMCIEVMEPSRLLF